MNAVVSRESLDACADGYVHIARQRDELVAVIKDLRFGAQMMQQSVVPMSRDCVRYSAEVERVCTEALRGVQS